MQIPKLDVRISITPHPSSLPTDELDRLFAGEVRAFEEWVIANQRKIGHPNPQGLINAERAIVQSYMMYVHSKEP